VLTVAWVSAVLYKYIDGALPAFDAHTVTKPSAEYAISVSP